MNDERAKPEPFGEEELMLLHEPTRSMKLFCYQRNKKVLKTVQPISDTRDLDALFAASRETPQPVKEALGGRATLIPFSDEGGNRFVLKSYRRGGLFRKLLPGGTFLGWGEERSQREMSALLSATEIGILVPEPVGTLVRGKSLKSEWLIMRTLPAHQTLASIALQVESKSEEAPIEEYLEEVVRMIELLIQHKLFHVDLHPGNVVVDHEGSVYLIDFDHAERVNLSARQLRDRYIRRWRRAVIKHELPEFLSEIFCSLLRRKFEEWERDGEALSPEGTSS